MIGPGTGVAPYRAFLQERQNTKAKGENWLVFGECHRKTDYYYEEYFESLHKKKFLKINLAFSRDQEKKIYVQDRLMENSFSVWKLIESGGTVFVCGDAKRMAKDVSATLQIILEKEGNLSTQDARSFMKEMRRGHKLLMDVY